MCTLRGPPYAHPLMNFVWLLLVAIEHGESIAVFSLLVDKYRASLQRDPSYLGYLDRCKTCYFEGCVKPVTRGGIHATSAKSRFFQLDNFCPFQHFYAV